MTDTPKDKRAFVEPFERLWSQALVAVSAAEDEAAKMAGRVAELYGWSQEEVRRQVRELSERLTSQRREIERSVEEGVKRTLRTLRVPRREELAELEARLERVAQRLDALEQEA